VQRFPGVRRVPLANGLVDARRTCDEVGMTGFDRTG
jgi:hypothetical protein